MADRSFVPGGVGWVDQRYKLRRGRRTSNPSLNLHPNDVHELTGSGPRAPTGGVRGFPSGPETRWKRSVGKGEPRAEWVSSRSPSVHGTPERWVSSPGTLTLHRWRGFVDTRLRPVPTATDEVSQRVRGPVQTRCHTGEPQDPRWLSQGVCEPCVSIAPTPVFRFVIV